MLRALSKQDWAHVAFSRQLYGGRITATWPLKGRALGPGKNALSSLHLGHELASADERSVESPLL